VGVETFAGAIAAAVDIMGATAIAEVATELTGVRRAKIDAAGEGSPAEDGTLPAGVEDPPAEMSPAPGFIMGHSGPKP
jgi:hypothetical protein